MPDLISTLLFLSLFALVPAALLAFARVSLRRFLLVVGLIAGFLSEYRIGSGPDNPLAIFPLVAFGVSAGASIVEAASLLVRMTKRLKMGASGQASQAQDL